MKVSSGPFPPPVTPAQTYWNQRSLLSSRRERVLALARAVGRPGDLYPYQWAQLMAFTVEFAPDFILELGRGYGNSTCAFTEAAHLLKPRPCRVLSLCKSTDWGDRIEAQVRKTVPAAWFVPLDAREADILTFDHEAALAGFERVLVFWDAHGYDVAECVLGRILPRIADRAHVVIMHDLSDGRYLPAEQDLYGDHRLWRGNDWSGPRLRIGHIDSGVEQAVAILDFTTRNKLELHSADHSLRTEIGSDPKRLGEMQSTLGDQLFSLSAHWFWFSLNERTGPYTFPRYQPPEPPPPKAALPKTTLPKVTLKTRLKAVAKILLHRFPEERLR